MDWKETTLGKIGQVDLIIAFISSNSIEEMRSLMAKAYLPVITDGDEWHIIGRFEALDG